MTVAFSLQFSLVSHLLDPAVSTWMNLNPYSLQQKDSPRLGMNWQRSLCARQSNDSVVCEVEIFALNDTIISEITIAMQLYWVPS